MDCQFYCLSSAVVLPMLQSRHAAVLPIGWGQEGGRFMAYTQGGRESKTAKTFAQYRPLALVIALIC